MSSLADRPIHTLADLIDRLGRVPLDRVRFHPPPGTATERDVLDVAEREDRLCELKDGVLVEKVMGYGESILAVFVARMLGNFVSARNLGHVTGEQGMVRLFPGLIRIPDVAFASWERFPERRWAGEAIPDVVPDLAVEVLSDSNTAAEMKMKLGEYFSAGVRQVWLVEIGSRTVTVFEAVDKFVTLHENASLNGGNILPGFTLSLTELFAELDRHG
jgi:Uma2 family endonuclease